MARQLSLFLSAFVLFFSASCAYASDSAATSFVKKTCDDSTYVSLCLDTLLPNAERINRHPKKSTRLAIMATITEVQTVSSKLESQAKQPKLWSHEVNSLNECGNMIADSVLGLNQAMEASQHLGGGSKSDKESKRLSLESDVKNVLTAANRCVSNMQTSQARDVLITRVEKIMEPLVELATNAVDLIHRIQF